MWRGYTLTLLCGILMGSVYGQTGTDCAGEGGGFGYFPVVGRQDHYLECLGGQAMERRCPLGTVFCESNPPCGCYGYKLQGGEDDEEFAAAGIDVTVAASSGGEVGGGSIPTTPPLVSPPSDTPNPTPTPQNIPTEQTHGFTGTTARFTPQVDVQTNPTTTGPYIDNAIVGETLSTKHVPKSQIGSTLGPTLADTSQSPTTTPTKHTPSTVQVQSKVALNPTPTPQKYTASTVKTQPNVSKRPTTTVPSLAEGDDSDVITFLPFPGFSMQSTTTTTNSPPSTPKAAPQSTDTLPNPPKSTPKDASIKAQLGGAAVTTGMPTARAQHSTTRRVSGTGTSGANGAGAAPLPSGGCPDPFMKIMNTNKPLGVEMGQYTTLRRCQEGCFGLGSCVGIDWNKENNVPANQKCFFLFENSTSYREMSNTCCDHYKVTNCGNDKNNQSPLPATGATTENPATSQSTQPQNQRTVVTNGVPVTTTTIPDTGCPYIYEKFTNKGHPFGQNITNGVENDEIEECKHWCLIRSFCIAVDFDITTRTCYYHRVIDDSLITTQTNVNHYQKVDCQPPLNCWYKITGSDDNPITYTTTPQVQCNGFCYIRKNITADVTDRGCWPKSGLNGLAPTKPGCSIFDVTDFSTLICFCDNDRCNGLSLATLSSQLVYLPLDQDMEDHSGNERNGIVTRNYAAPAYSCFDKKQNCSAYFSGSSCVAIPQLTSTQWAFIYPDGRTEDRVSFCIWFKRIFDGFNGAEGIFGNQADNQTFPSWRIQGANSSEFLEAGIDTASDLSDAVTLSDYTNMYAASGSWHLACMVYDGREDLSNPAAPKIPTLSFYIDGVKQLGNARSDSGAIDLRNQPATLGCVMLKNFTGFLDEARIFTSALDEMEIQSLMTMTDDNFN